MLFFSTDIHNPKLFISSTTLSCLKLDSIPTQIEIELKKVNSNSIWILQMIA